jgi:hypothetical protein
METQKKHGRKSETAYSPGKSSNFRATTSLTKKTTSGIFPGRHPAEALHLSQSACQRAHCPGAGLRPLTRKASGRILIFHPTIILGYFRNPEVIREVQDTLAKYGTGAASAPLFSGYYDVTERLEKKIAAFKTRKPRGISHRHKRQRGRPVRSAQGRATSRFWTSWPTPPFTTDEAAGRGRSKSSATTVRAHLERVLKSLTPGGPSSAVEGVYSMDGDLARLPEIVALCRKYGVKILIDEAHATLDFRRNTAAVAEHFGVEDAMDISIGNLQQSFGAIGGFCRGRRKADQLSAFFRPVRIFLLRDGAAHGGGHPQNPEITTATKASGKNSGTMSATCIKRLQTPASISRTRNPRWCLFLSERNCALRKVAGGFMKKGCTPAS